jgi:acetoin utilization protein AcuB
MRVSDLMTRNVVTMPMAGSCQEAVARMHRAGIRHLPVVDERGALAGIVTDRDLRHRLFSPPVWRHIGSVSVDTLLGSVTVKEIMSSPVVSVGPDDDLETAARRMLEDKVGSLPVVAEGRVVGIITETDLLRRIVETDACSPEVGAIIVSYP